MAGATFAHIVKQRGLSDRFDRIESAGTAECVAPACSS